MGKYVLACLTICNTFGSSEFSAVFFSAELSILQEVFPKLPLQKLQTALTVYKTADETASFLLREEQVDTACGTDGNKIIPKPIFQSYLTTFICQEGTKSNISES